MLELIYGEDLSVYEQSAEEAGIPDYMAEPIYQYVEHHEQRGCFLMALLANDLQLTLARADKQNGMCLLKWMMFLLWCVPDKCWGSPEAVAKWLENKSHEAEENA